MRQKRRRERGLSPAFDAGSAGSGVFMGGIYQKARVIRQKRPECRRSSTAKPGEIREILWTSGRQLVADEFRFSNHLDFKTVEIHLGP
jgi:hypothetical protein